MVTTMQPSTADDVARIVSTLQTLPPEKVADVRDYVLFLQNRYASAPVVDERDDWSDEDLFDATVSSLRYAEQSLGPEDGYDN